jgi:glycosyltransferase involved in cell wall biosynthesis
LAPQATLYFLLPGDPATLTGGYIYDRRIREGLSARGWTVHVSALDDSFPFATPAALDEAAKVLAAIPDGSLVVIDGLALGGMPELIAEHAPRLSLVALIHHPLPDETGLTSQDRASLADSERRALAHVRHVIVTSGWTAQRLARDGIPLEQISVVMPGTEPAPLATGSDGSELRLLCVATLTPRKGHAVLFDALAQLTDKRWHLDCVGSLTRDAVTAEALRRQIERCKLTKRVTLVGEAAPDALDAYYAGADLFVLASYLEGYGMAHAEALARGLPMVTTAAGAVPDTVPSNAAVIVPPGDRGALARALGAIIDDPKARATLTEGARAARAKLPTWAATCEHFDAALRALD